MKIEKIVLMGLLILIFIPFVSSAWGWDNIKQYDEESKTVTIVNTFGLGKDVATITLNTPHNFGVIRGEDRKVAEFTINPFYNASYNDIFKKMDFYDSKNKKNKFSRKFTYKYKVIEYYEAPHYKFICEDKTFLNGTEYKTCYPELVEMRRYEKVKWIPLKSGDVLKGEATIGIFTDVYPNEKVEWIPNLFGVTINEWAEWTENLDDGLRAFYSFDNNGTSGSTAWDLVDGTFNGTIVGAKTGQTGKLGEAYEFNRTVITYVNLGYVVPAEAADDFAIGGWFKTGRHDTLYGTIATDDTTGGNPDWSIVVKDNRLKFKSYVIPPDTSAEIGSALNVSNETWYFFTAMKNATTVEIWMNGEVQVTSDLASGDMDRQLDIQVGELRQAGTDEFEGLLDNIFFYNRTLSQEEISAHYNANEGLGYHAEEEEEPPAVDPIVTLVSPTNNSVTSEQEINFIANYTNSSVGTNLSNATYHVWRSNGTLYNDSVIIEISGQSNETNESIENLIIGEYIWNSLLWFDNSTGSFTTWATNNYTLTIAGEFFNFTNATIALETSYQSFSVILEVPEETTIQAGSGALYYNGTRYSTITATSLGEDQYNLSRSLSIPVGTTGFSSENRSFYWNITVVDQNTGETFIQTSAAVNQTVNELKFGTCGGTVLTIPMLNFTMYDEESGVVVNATAHPTTFQTTFFLGVNSENLAKNVSVNNITETVNEYDFCTDSNTNIFFTNMEAFFTAEDYVDKNYYLNNASLSNDTSEITLYLLNESSAIEFFIDAEQDLLPLTSATVSIAKYFVGEGLYKTVEIDETSSDAGEFTAYLDLDKKYQFTISKDDQVLGIIIKTASCKAAPCEMTLSVSSADADVYSSFSEAFARNVLYNLTWDPTTKIVTFEFIDTTGLANSFQMWVYRGSLNSSSALIYNNTLFASSGSMTANLSNYTEGDFLVQTYIARSPYSFIDFLTITISDITRSLGLLGLFVGFLIVMVIIFGLSFSPPILVFSVPLSLTVVKLMGIVSISTTAIVVIYVLAAIAVAFLSR